MAPKSMTVLPDGGKFGKWNKPRLGRNDELAERLANQLAQRAMQQYLAAEGQQS